MLVGSAGLAACIRFHFMAAIPLWPPAMLGMTLKEYAVLCECPCSYDALSPLVISQQRGEILTTKQSMQCLDFCWTCIVAKIPFHGGLLRRNDVERGFSIMRMSLLLRCTFTPRHLAGTRRDLDHKAKHEMLGFLLDMHRGKDSIPWRPPIVGMTVKEDSA
jgi:hypothetical protein